MATEPLGPGFLEGAITGATAYLDIVDQTKTWLAEQAHPHNQAIDEINAWMVEQIRLIQQQAREAVKPHQDANDALMGQAIDYLTEVEKQPVYDEFRRQELILVQRITETAQSNTELLDRYFEAESDEDDAGPIFVSLTEAQKLIDGIPLRPQARQCLVSLIGKHAHVEGLNREDGIYIDLDPQPYKNGKKGEEIKVGFSHLMSSLSFELTITGEDKPNVPLCSFDHVAGKTDQAIESFKSLHYFDRLMVMYAALELTRQVLSQHIEQ